MTAAYELRKAGYRVQILEYNGRRRRAQLVACTAATAIPSSAASRSAVQFDRDLYFNPGPWRIPLPPSRPAELLQAARGAARAVRAGELRRHRAQQPSLRRQAAALSRDHRRISRPRGRAALKGAQQHALDAGGQRARIRRILLEALREWGALDGSYAYGEGMRAASGAAFGRTRAAASRRARFPRRPWPRRDSQSQALDGIPRAIPSTCRRHCSSPWAAWADRRGLRP